MTQAVPASVARSQEEKRNFNLSPLQRTNLVLVTCREEFIFSKYSSLDAFYDLRNISLRNKNNEDIYMERMCKLNGISVIKIKLKFN